MRIRSLVAHGLACTLLLGAFSCRSGEDQENNKPQKEKNKLIPKDPVLASGNHLLITEIVPHGEHAFKDADDEASDWIELHNNSSEVISLGAFALTDDEQTPLKWQFPEHPLEPGAFVIVFASGKDRTEAGSHLHSNFKLDSDGEYLALVRIENERAVHTFAPVFPKIPKGKSYGYEFEDGRVNTDKLRLFDTPSPGKPNSDQPAEPEAPDSNA